VQAAGAVVREPGAVVRRGYASASSKSQDADDERDKKKSQQTRNGTHGNSDYKLRSLSEVLRRDHRESLQTQER